MSSVEHRRRRHTDPDRIAFDANGVCAACRVADRKRATDWPERERALRALLDQYRRGDGRPDVLIPGSGGKDSVLAAHKLKYEFGMHPLLITWAPHAYTEVGWRNYQAWLSGGFTAMLITPNPIVHRMLTLLAFTNLLHPFQPFVLGQKYLAPRIAAQLGIDLVFYGENGAEYDGAGQWKAIEPAHESIYLSGVRYEYLVSMYKFEPADLAPYLPPNQEDLTRIRVEALGDYLPWQPQAAYYFAAERDFEANDERTEGTYSKYNSIDDRLDPLHYYTSYIKFGLGRASYDAAQEIRNGHLTREEGVALVKKYDGEVRSETVAWACGYMGITPEMFWQRIAAEREARPWLWHGETLRHRVWDD